MTAKCWMRDGCPCQTGACNSSQPTDDGCPVYRWFNDLFCKNEPIIARNIQHDVGIGGCPKCGYTLATFMNYCPKCGQAVKWREE